MVRPQFRRNAADMIDHHIHRKGQETFGELRQVLLCRTILDVPSERRDPFGDGFQMRRPHAALEFNTEAKTTYAAGMQCFEFRLRDPRLRHRHAAGVFQPKRRDRVKDARIVGIIIQDWMITVRLRPSASRTAT